MRGLLRFANAVALGVALERWRQSWRSSAWAYHQRYGFDQPPLVTQQRRRP